MPKIVIYSDDQENQEIAVLNDKGEELFSQGQDHDQHGWDGMEVARDIAEGIGQALGIAVEREYKEFN
jgi:hypothetical protein